MEKKKPEQCKREFRTRQSRQIIAITVAMLAVLLPAVFYKRPELLGALSKSALFGAQVAAIAAFLGYTALNWRCPSCGKSLGHDIHRTVCRHCGSKLQ